MIETIPQNNPNPGLQERVKPVQRPRQGMEPPEGKRVASASQETQVKPLDKERVTALTDQLNESLGKMDGSFHVSVDDDSGMMVVRITDTETGEIVRQVPPQQVIDANVSMEKIIGLLVNDQA
jgi:flagellar protein FlaG